MLFLAATLSVSGGLLPFLLVSFCVSCSSSSEPSGSGPYVQSVTSESVVVAAVTDSPVRLRLRYGQELAPGEAPIGTSVYTGEVVEATNVSVHGLQASGLEANTRYVYLLETVDGAGLGGGSFLTAPVGRESPCTFLVVGDTGGTNESQGELIDNARAQIDKVRGVDDDENQQDRVVAAMLQRPADLVLHTGDVVYPAGAREDYPEAYFKPFAPLIRNVPVYPTIGNHDIKTENGAPYLETFFTPANGPTSEGRVYSFDWGMVHFVSLDVMSSAFAQGSEQAAWLAKDLADNNARWTVVFFHAPPYSPRGRGSEDIRQELVPLLEGAKVDLVLSGHDHSYARYLPKGHTTYVVSGGGGKSLYSLLSDDGRELAYAESVFHFLEVSVTTNLLHLKAIDTTGNVFDELKLVK